MTHVYALLIDIENRRIALNLKDATLPEKARAFEGKIGLFGGKIEPGEDPEIAVLRELSEEIPGFIKNSLPGLSMKSGPLALYVIPTDLSGDKTNRTTSRIGELARVCTEGDAIVRSFEWVATTNETDWLWPKTKKMIEGIISTYENPFNK